MFARIRDLLAAWRLNPNQLAEHERTILQATADAEFPRSFVGLSLRHQLLRILRVRVQGGGGLGWLKRKIHDTETILRFQILIGAEYALPELDSPLEIRAEVACECGAHSYITFQLPQSVHLTREHSVTCGHERLRVRFPGLTDEYDAWQERWAGSEFPEIANAGLKALRCGEFSPNVILALPGHDTTLVTHPIHVPAESNYGRLLRFADGIVINKLCIHSLAWTTARRFEHRGATHAPLGHDARGALYIRVENGTATDELRRQLIQSGREERVHKSLLELCAAALCS